MQFVQLVWSSFKFAFRIQERLGRGEGYNDTYAARVSTFVLAIIVGWLLNPIVDGTPTPRVDHSGASLGTSLSRRWYM
jgi:hypothetical protein